MKLMYQQGHDLSDGSRGESLLASSSVWCLVAILGILWLVNASLQSHGHLLHACLPIIFLLCGSVPMSKYPFFFS